MVLANLVQSTHPPGENNTLRPLLACCCCGGGSTHPQLLHTQNRLLDDAGHFCSTWPFSPWFPPGSASTLGRTEKSGVMHPLVTSSLVRCCYLRNHCLATASAGCWPDLHVHEEIRLRSFLLFFLRSLERLSPTIFSPLRCPAWAALETIGRFRR